MSENNFYSMKWTINRGEKILGDRFHFAANLLFPFFYEIIILRCYVLHGKWMAALILQMIILHFIVCSELNKKDNLSGLLDGSWWITLRNDILVYWLYQSVFTPCVLWDHTRPFLYLCINVWLSWEGRPIWSQVWSHCSVVGCCSSFGMRWGCN